MTAPWCEHCCDSHIEFVCTGHGNVLEIPCSMCTPVTFGQVYTDPLVPERANPYQWVDGALIVDSPRDV